MTPFLVMAFSMAPWAGAQNQGELHDIPKPDVSEELAQFEVAEGFEVNLFASDPMIANPIAMSWDADGRLWVAGSSLYPHIAPGQQLADSITVLEDLDGDGVDNATEYANVLDAGGGTDDFVNAAADATLDGTEGDVKTSGCAASSNVRGPHWILGELAVIMAILLVLARRRRSSIG